MMTYDSIPQTPRGALLLVEAEGRIRQSPSIALPVMPLDEWDLLDSIMDEHY
jgi:hypothetical protein